METMIKPPSALSYRGELWADVAMDAAFKPTKLSCQSRAIGRATGEKLHSFPAKKLRKLLHSASDAVNFFCSVDPVVMALDDLEGPEDDFVPGGKSSGRKRRWQTGNLKWKVCAASAAGGSGALFGFRELYRRISKINPECTGGNSLGQNGGSGGDWSGGGHGGGDHGGDKMGPGDFGANNEALRLTDLNASEKDTEDERGFLPQQEESDPGSKILESEISHLLSSFTEGTREMPENEMQDMATSHEVNPKILPESNPVEEAFDNQGLNEHLAKVVCALYLHLAKFFWGLSTLTLGPVQVLYSGGNNSWNHSDGERESASQDHEMALGVEGFPEPLEKEVLQKLQGLTLESVQASPIGKEQAFSEKQVPAGIDVGNAYQGTRKGLKTDGQSVTGVAGFNGLNLPEGQRVSATSSGRLISAESSESELPSKASHTVGQSPGLIDWLAGLVRSVLTKQRGGHGRSSEAKQVEEGNLKDLVSGTVSSALKQLFETEGDRPVAKWSDVEALRRLQREVFSDLLKIRGKLEKIEQSIQMRQSNRMGNLPGVGRTHLKGEVKAGTAFVLLEDSNSRHSRASLEQAGMQTGLDVRFTFETPFREKDLLITQCVAGQGSSVGDGRALGGPLTLGKVLYVAHVNDNVSISFVPLGAQGKDVTEIISPLQDQGLTAFSSNGPALFNNCQGSAVGATVNSSNFAFSLAQYLSGWGNHMSASGPAATESDPFCLSTLGQILFQPSEHIIFSLSGLNRYWPSPPLPSSMGLHWSEMGPLVIPRIRSLRTSRSTVTSQASMSTSVSHASSVGSNWVPDYCNDAVESKGTALQSVAIAGEVDMGENISFGGWLQMERGDWLQDPEKGNIQWALNLAKTTGSVVNWGASIGGCRPDFWSTTTDEQEAYPGYLGGIGESYEPQLHLEAFLKINCGGGFTLQPGMLYVMNKHSHTPAFMVRSSWSL